MKKIFIYIGIFLFLIFLVFRFSCGILVIQPIGFIPEGKTIIYYKGKDLDLPFIASADGILNERDGGVSILSRGVLLGELGEKIKGKIILRLPYSKTLYLYSTNGVEFEK